MPCAPSPQAFSSKFLELDQLRTGGRIYLNIKSRKVPKPAPAPSADGAEPAVTKFAIGVDGGFQTEDTMYNTEYTYEVVQFPGPVTAPYAACVCCWPVEPSCVARQSWGLLCAHTDVLGAMCNIAWPFAGIPRQICQHTSQKSSRLC